MHIGSKAKKRIPDFFCSDMIKSLSLRQYWHCFNSSLAFASDLHVWFRSFYKQFKIRLLDSLETLLYSMSIAYLSGIEFVAQISTLFNLTFIFTLQFLYLLCIRHQAIKHFVFNVLCCIKRTLGKLPSDDFLLSLPFVQSDQPLPTNIIRKDV